MLEQETKWEEYVVIYQVLEQEINIFKEHDILVLVRYWMQEDSSCNSPSNSELRRNQIMRRTALFLRIRRHNSQKCIYEHSGELWETDSDRELLNAERIRKGTRYCGANTNLILRTTATNEKANETNNFWSAH